MIFRVKVSRKQHGYIDVESCNLEEALTLAMQNLSNCVWSSAELSPCVFESIERNLDLESPD